MTVTVTNNTEKTVKKIKALGRTFCSKLDGGVFQNFPTCSCVPEVPPLVSKALLGPWNCLLVPAVMTVGP